MNILKTSIQKSWRKEMYWDDILQKNQKWSRQK